jgi:hypothetical protein
LLARFSFGAIVFVDSVVVPAVDGTDGDEDEDGMSACPGRGMGQLMSLTS